MKVLLLIALTLFTFSFIYAAEPSEATKRLLERNKMFEPLIIKVSDNVYTAIGYQVSTNSMIIGDDGVIIIDPGLAMPFGEQVRKEFEKITDKPIKAIIYTHDHGDHTNAARAFYDEGKGIQVWACSNFGSERARNEQTGFTDGVRPDVQPAIGLLVDPVKRFVTY